MIRYVDLKIFVEGIELKQFNSVTLYTGTVTAPSMQIQTSLVNKVRVLLPGTLIQCFFRSKSEDDNWYLMFEGYLSKINLIKTDTSEYSTLIVSGTESVLEKYKHAKQNAIDPLRGVTADVVYVNLGGTTQASIPFSNPTGTEISDNFLSVTLWDEANKKAQDVVFTKDLEYAPDGLFVNSEIDFSTKGGFPEFIYNIMKGVTLNNPYIKIIDDSLNLIKRYKIYPNDKMFALAKDVQALTDLRQQLITSNAMISYKDTIDRILNVGIAKINYLGIPTTNSNDEIVTALVLPTNEFIPPPLQNVILLDEYKNYQLSINFDSEPTRALNASFSLTLGEPLGLVGKMDVLPTFLSPVNELLLEPVKKDEKGKVKYYLKFTKEEKYRGINPIFTSSTIYEYSYALFRNAQELSNLILTEEQLKEEAEKVGLGSNVGFFERMLYLSEMSFLKKRLEARGVGTISVPYFNPNWLLGFPGLIVTKDHGPILTMFDSIVVNVNAEGRANTILSVSKPRFLDDYVAMDWPAPDWYDEYYDTKNIGKLLYNDYSKYGKELFKEKGCSIVDFANTLNSETPIEDAAKAIWETPQIPFESRKRNFVRSSDYFNKLNTIVGVDEFPHPSVTAYRKAEGLDALTILEEANRTKKEIAYLKCPYVYERGVKVLEWMHKEADLHTPLEFNTPDPIDPSTVDLGKMTDPVENTGSTTPLLPVSPASSDTLKKVQGIAKDVVLQASDLVNTNYNMGTNYAKTVNDLTQGKGNPSDSTDVSNLTENMLNFIVDLQNSSTWKNRFKITKIISAHSSTTEGGRPSAHASGRSIDIVGVVMGIPNKEETTKLYNHINTMKSMYKITDSHWYPNYSGTDTKSLKGAHSPIGHWGMHIHVSFGN